MTALLRVGSRVRSLTDDGFVTAGKTGTVLSVVHPGYAGNHSGWDLIHVQWDDDCVSRVPVESIEVLEAAA